MGKGITHLWRPKTLECKNPDCETIFTQESRCQKYCSVKCREETNDNKRIRNRHCLQCGKRLTRYKKKFCNDTCIAEYNKDRWYQRDNTNCIRCDKELGKNQIKFCSDYCKVRYGKEDKICLVCDKPIKWGTNRTKTCSEECRAEYKLLWQKAKYRGITIEEAKTLTTYQRADTISDYGITKLERARKEREKNKEARPKTTKKVSKPKKVKIKKVKVKPKKIKEEVPEQKCPVCKTIFTPVYDGQRGCKKDCEMAIYKHERGI